jgi:predicted GIY-YIG superfamily endonuclease
MSRCCVYDVMHNGKLIYVGMSKTPDKRLSWHKSRGNVPRDAVVRVVAWYDSRRDALYAEAVRIAEKKPPLNEKWCRTRSPDAMPIEKAFKLWTSSKLTTKQKLARMRGWTLSMARQRFGSPICSPFMRGGKYVSPAVLRQEAADD